MRLVYAIAAAAALALGACSQADVNEAQDTTAAAADEAGAAVGEAADSVGEAASAAGEAVEGAVNEAATEVEHATDDNPATH